MSPTERSLKHLRAQGWSIHKTEHWNAFAKRRIDAFNFGDLLGCKPDAAPTMFQVTTTGNMSARLQKAKDYAGPLVAWLTCGGRLTIQGWAKRGGRGERKTWQLKERHLTLADLVDQKENAG
jgi:hypothetical protein